MTSSTPSPKDTSDLETPWVPNERNALEQLQLLQPDMMSVVLAAGLGDIPDSGQLIWEKDAFRVFWISRSPLYNIGCRGHFREQTEDGCCLLVPGGVPVFFWREGFSSYCNDLEFGASEYDVGHQSPEHRKISFMESGEAGKFAACAVAFRLGEHLAKLALPIFTENTVLRVNDPAFHTARTLMEQILQLPEDNALLGGQLVKTFLMALVKGAQQTNQLVMTTIPREAAENPHVIEVLRIVAERLNDSSLNLEAIASDVHLNPSYLSGLFSQLMQKTLVRYIQEKRVLAARRLLLTNPHLSIKEIMAQVGINTPQQMSRTFKKILGCSPSEFREKLD